MVFAEAAAVLAIITTVKEAIGKAITLRLSKEEKEKEVKKALVKVLKRFKLDYEQFEGNRQFSYFEDCNELFKKYREALLTIIFDIEDIVEGSVITQLKTLTSSIQNAINIMTSLGSQKSTTRKEKRQAGKKIMECCNKMIQELEKK